MKWWTGFYSPAECLRSMTSGLNSGEELLLGCQHSLDGDLVARCNIEHPHPRLAPLRFNANAPRARHQFNE